LVPLRRRALSGWHRQSPNPPHHASKQVPRQTALCQQEPAIASVPDQPTPAFTNRCCKLVSDRFSMFFGSAKRRRADATSRHVGPRSNAWAALASEYHLETMCR